MSLRNNFFNLSKVKREKDEREATYAIDQEKYYKRNKIKKVHTLGFFTAGTLTFFHFLLMAEGLALVESFKARSPWKMGGMSTH